ncbi:MAG: transcription initiation factor IIB [archaeon]|nr:transcription initiation factor IIB [archaeon]
MEETRERAERTETCPYCRKGFFQRPTPESKLTCTVCEAYFANGTLYRGRTELLHSNEESGTQLYRFRKWQQRIRVSNATERNLAFALSELDRLSIANNLPRTVRESASTIYRKAVSRNLIRGRSIEGVVAASIYAACRICGMPRTIEEVAETSIISKKELGRTYRFLARELKLNLMPARPQDYVQRFCNTLDLDVRVQTAAKDLLDSASSKDLLSGLGPKGVAAGAVYISAILCEQHRSQREVADTASISEVTLRCRYKRLAEGLGITIEFS